MAQGDKDSLMVFHFTRKTTGQRGTDRGSTSGLCSSVPPCLIPIPAGPRNRQV